MAIARTPSAAAYATVVAATVVAVTMGLLSSCSSTGGSRSPATDSVVGEAPAAPGG
jgi:hypothetical protein